MLNVGDKIYVPTSYYIENIFGGLATVEKIEENDDLPKEHLNRACIYVEEHPGHGYNSIHLINNQERWEREYNNRIAYLGGTQ